MSNTEFEGGDDGHGHGDCTFLVKQAQPSHMSNSIPRVPGGVVRAGASAEAAQSTPLWATLSPGPKKAPCVCCHRAWGTLNYQNMPKYYLHVYLCVYLHVCLCIYKHLCK